MTITANVAGIWRRTVAFLEGLEQVALDPLAEQQRRIASLSKRIGDLETANVQR